MRRSRRIEVVSYPARVAEWDKERPFYLELVSEARPPAHYFRRWLVGADLAGIPL